MAQRRLAYPGTMLQAQNLITRTQDVFSGGINSDFPGSEIATDELADLFNMLAFPKYLRSRTGDKLLDEIGLPTITVYDTNPEAYQFEAYKVGNRVHIIDGVDRVYTDLIPGNYIKWSIDDSRDQITTLVAEAGGAYFDAAVSGDKANDTAVEQQGQVWGAAWDKLNQRIIIHIDTRLFHTTIAFAEYIEIDSIGDVDVVANSRSRFVFDDEQVILFNANGIFRIIADADSGYYFKINSGQPTARIYENSNESELRFKRNRIYTLSRILGPGCLFGNRGTAGCVIQHETAPVLPDGRRDSSIDWSDDKIGPGRILYWRVTSGDGMETDISVWQAISSGAFKISVNSLPVQTIVCDFTECRNMLEVAAEIQLQMRAYFTGAICQFDNSTGTAKFVIHGGEANGTVLSLTESPDMTGTPVWEDITDLMVTNDTFGDLVQVTADAPKLIYELNLDSQKFTHFSLYAAKNTGEEGIALGNIEDFLTWAKDIPIIKCFTGDRDALGVITVATGEKIIDLGDVGSFLCWADADREWEQLDYTINPLTFLPSTNDLEASVQGDATIGSVKDNVPVAIGAKKISRAYQTGTTVTLDPTYDNTWNRFEAGDVGKILFVEDGSVRHIVEFLNDHAVIVHESDEFGAAFGTQIFLAVAWDPIMRSDTGDENTKIIDVDKEASSGGGYSEDVNITRNSGSLFEAGDVGKNCYVLHNGVFYGKKFNTNIGIKIKSVGADGQTAVIGFDDTTFPLQAATSGLTFIISDYMPARFFNDYVYDEDLAAYEDDPAYVLQTRFFRPLPSSAIGEIGADFMAVAVDGKISYGAVPSIRKYIAGFYHPTWQADTAVRDTITLLKCYAGRMVALGKRSTWGSNFLSFSTVKQEAIGEDIFTVPVFTLIDNIGLIHADSIQDVAVGQSIMLCNDASVRIFDGRQFSKIDFAQNKIFKKLRLWHHRVCSSYDLVGGYILYGSPNVSSDSKSYVNAVEGECYRFAVISSQGAGWSRFGGTSMIFPMPNTGGLNVDDANGMPLQIVLDETTGAWHQINTYNGPAGSGLVESQEDKESEVTCSFKGKIHTGERQSVMLEHMESHISIEPLVQGGSYRDAFSVTARIFVENNVVKFASTLDTPVDGDIVFDRKANSRDIQNEFEFTAAGVIVTQSEIIYTSRDTAGATAMDARPTSESNYQQEYGEI